MKTPIVESAAILVATSMFSGTVLADPKVKHAPEHNQKVEEQAVLITGSLIPQRIKVLPIGTTTVSPIRVIDRHQIDWTRRSTTAGAFINEPSVRVIGH